MSDDGIVLKIDLPDAVYNRLAIFIEETVASALQKHVDAIQKTPKHYTRAEAKEIIRTSLVTLDKHLKSGRIKSKTIGRRVLIPAEQLDQFLQPATV